MNGLQVTPTTKLVPSLTYKAGDCLAKGISGSYKIGVYLRTSSPDGPLDFHIYNNQQEEYTVCIYPCEAFGDNLCGKYSEPLVASDYEKTRAIVSKSTLPEPLVKRFEQGIKGASLPCAMNQTEE